MATFTNKATLSYNGGSVDSNTVTGTFLETLAVTKTALTQEYAGGTRITYAISLVNTGTAAFTGLTLTDDLGGYPFDGTLVYPLQFEEGSLLYYVNGVLQPTLTPTSTQPLTIGGISVPAGGNALVLYVAEVGGAAPLDVGGAITNVVTVSGGGLPESLTATETVTAVQEPALTITKALSPVAVPENGTVTYTFVIENSGNTAAVATDDLTVTDLFDPILEITSVTLDGVVLTEGVGYTYDPATGAFATVPGVITVPAATYTQAPDGTYVLDPGAAVLVVTGTI